MLPVIGAALGPKLAACMLGTLLSLLLCRADAGCDLTSVRVGQALDKELAQHMVQDPGSCWPCLAFDESGNFVLFPSLLGIKVCLCAQPGSWYRARLVFDLLGSAGCCSSEPACGDWVPGGQHVTFSTLSCPLGRG